ncbi:MAG: thiamine phosphate synthase [Acidiphilium sp.]
MSELYLITPPQLDLARFPDELAAALDAGPIACVQLRLKEQDDGQWQRAIAVLRPIVQARGVAFLLNDRADLAVATGCDGAHLGQEDLGPGGVAAARASLGQRSLGITCHDSRHLAIEAADAGADYVAFGAFFPTRTKDATPAQIETLAWWCETMEVPAVAIGGIDARNCGPLVRAGAEFLAVIGAVWHHPDGAAAGVRAMQDAISAARQG